MLTMTPQEEGRYRVLLIQVGKNTEEEKDTFCGGISTKYDVAIPLLKKIVDSSPIVLKENLSLRKAEILADILASFGATTSVEKRWNGPPVFVEFQEMMAPWVALETCALRKTAWGTWNVLGRVTNITPEPLNDVWVLVQLFGDADEFLVFEEVPVLINPLPAGETAPFKAVFEGGLPVKRISLAFKDSSGRPLPSKDLLTKKRWIPVAPGRPLERDPLQDSDPDVAVLEIHGKADPLGLQKEEAGGPYLLPASEELYLEIEPDVSHKDSPAIAGGGEDIGEDEVARLTGEFLSISSSEPVLDQESDRSLLKEALESQDVELPASEPVSEAGTQEIPHDEARLFSAMDDGEPLAEIETQLPQPVGKELDERIEQPEEVQFKADMVPPPSPSEYDSVEMPFPWIEDLKKAVEAYYRQDQDGFSIWLGEQGKKGEFRDPFHCLLTILIHARFDQMCSSEKTLENTKRVYALILKPDLTLDDIPPLEGTRFSPGERWRILFCRAIPRLREVASQVMTKEAWDALELERLIQVIPHMSERGSRRAVRWISEIMGEVVRIDFSRTFPAVTEGLYRVACRLGVVAPNFDQFRGRNSLGDLKIQSFARMAFPSHPGRIEEAMDWIGMEEEKGGHCFPTGAKCDDCLFEKFCEKLHTDYDPSEKGMMSRFSAKGFA